MNQEECIKRNRWLGKGDQSSQNWSFTITVQAANSSAVSKAGSRLGTMSCLARFLFLTQLYCLSVQLTGQPGCLGCLGYRPVCLSCLSCLMYLTMYSTFYGLLMNNAERRNEQMLAQNKLTHVTGIFLHLGFFFIYSTNPHGIRVKETLKKYSQVLFKMQITCSTKAPLSTNVHSNLY